jgi:carbonic anhydrase
MPSTPSPNARSLSHLRSLGYTAQLVEHRDRYGHTHDLLGFVDVLGLRDDETLAVQATSIDHVSHRIAKIAEAPEYAAAKAAGWRIVVHGWRPWSYEGRLNLLREVEL